MAVTCPICGEQTESTDKWMEHALMQHQEQVGMLCQKMQK